MAKRTSNKPPSFNQEAESFSLLFITGVLGYNAATNQVLAGFDCMPYSINRSNLCVVKTREYVYRGDRLTGEQYKDKRCTAILRRDGKCIRGKNGNMLVSFNGTKVVVLARQLRKTPSGNLK